MQSQSTDDPNFLQAVLRIGAHTAWDALFRPLAHDPQDVPRSIDAVTTDWLSSVLCANAPDAHVTAFDLGPQTSGSTVRRRIDLRYNRSGLNADLPASVFAKSSPSFLNRIMLSFSRTIENEALFYRHIRPLLLLEAPVGYHSAYDLASGRSIHLLEDLVATKAATFCSPKSDIDRAKAEDLIGVLAALHGRFYDRIDLRTQFPWLSTYPEWFRAGYEGFGLRRFHEQAMTEAADVIPADISRRRDDLWAAQMRSLETHARMPSTLIHNDVHLGNWYITQAGRMGLCDWQCVTIGNWARDFSYAVGATLTIEDRRNWEKDLLRLYLEKLRAAGGESIPFEMAWTLYRQQMIAALLMWTVTLCHSPWMPDMQPRETSREMIRRLTTAMSDLDSIAAD